MIFIAYIIIGGAALAMVYFGHLQGQSQFYMSVFSAAFIGYCIYLDYQKRREKKQDEQEKSSGRKGSVKGKNSGSISKIAHKSTKDKNLK